MLRDIPQTPVMEVIISQFFEFVQDCGRDDVFGIAPSVWIEAAGPAHAAKRALSLGLRPPFSEPRGAGKDAPDTEGYVHRLDGSIEPTPHQTDPTSHCR